MLTLHFINLTIEKVAYEAVYFKNERKNKIVTAVSTD